MVVAVCGLLVFSAATPASAFGSDRSSESKGIPNMTEMKDTSKQAVEEDPRGMKEVQEKAREGSNAVQGGANIEKMNNNPANSQQATSVEDQVRNKLEDLTP